MAPRGDRHPGHGQYRHRYRLTFSFDMWHYFSFAREEIARMLLYKSAPIDEKRKLSSVNMVRCMKVRQKRQCAVLEINVRRNHGRCADLK